MSHSAAQAGAAATAAADTPARHGYTTMVFHWLHALLVLGLLGLGWYLADLPKGAERSAAITLHKSFGLCALILIGLRLGWRGLGRRLGDRRPPPLPGKAWEQAVARWTHRLLYLWLLLTPLAGFLSASFTKYTMRFFGLELPRLFAPDEALNLVFNTLHKATSTTLALLIGLHLAGTLVHLLRREKILHRMLPLL